MQIVPGQTPLRDRRLDVRSFALRRSAVRATAFDRIGLVFLGGIRIAVVRLAAILLVDEIILRFHPGFFAVASILLERVEVVRLRFWFRFWLRLEQPGNVACDAPFVPAEAPHTGFRIDDASSAACASAAKVAGPYRLPRSSTNQFLSS